MCFSQFVSVKQIRLNKFRHIFVFSKFKFLLLTRKLIRFLLLGLVVKTVRSSNVRPSFLTIIYSGICRYIEWWNQSASNANLREKMSNESKRVLQMNSRKMKMKLLCMKKVTTRNSKCYAILKICHQVTKTSSASNLHHHISRKVTLQLKLITSKDGGNCQTQIKR